MRFILSAKIFLILPSVAFSSCAENLELCLTPTSNGYWRFDEANSASILGEEIALPLSCLQNGLRFESGGELLIVPVSTRNYQRCEIALSGHTIHWQLIYSEIRFQWRIHLWTGTEEDPIAERFLAPRFPQSDESILLLSSDLLDARTGVRYLGYRWEVDTP